MFGLGHGKVVESTAEILPTEQEIDELCQSIATAIDVHKTLHQCTDLEATIEVLRDMSGEDFVVPFWQQERRLHGGDNCISWLDEYR